MTTLMPSEARARAAAAPKPAEPAVTKATLMSRAFVILVFLSVGSVTVGLAEIENEPFEICSREQDCAMRPRTRSDWSMLVSKFRLCHVE